MSGNMEEGVVWGAFVKSAVARKRSKIDRYICRRVPVV